MMTAWNSSYLFGYDNITGWGYRYYYAFYNEIGERDVIALILEVMLYILVFIISLFCNILVIVCIFRYSEIRTVTNSLLLNVAAADIVFILTLPAVLISRISNTWILMEASCKAFPYQQCVSAVTLLWTLSLISMDRHLCTVLPPYCTRITVRQAHILSATVWFILAVIFLPIAFYFRLQDATDISEFQKIFDLSGDMEIMKNASVYAHAQEILSDHYEILAQSKKIVKICTLVFPRSYFIDYAKWCLIAVLVICAIPMAILIYNYQAIFRKVMQSKNTWGSSCVSVSTASAGRAARGSQGNIGNGRRQSEISMSDVLAPWPRKHSNSSQLGPSTSGGRQGSLSRHEEIRASKHIKTARILFVNVVVVLAMWLPIMSVLVLIYLDGQRPSGNHEFFLRAHHFTAALMMLYLNTIITPLLFCLFSEDFLNSIKRLFRNTIFDGTRNGTTAHTGGSDPDGAIELNATKLGINRRKMDRTDGIRDNRDKVAPVTNGVRTVRNGTGISTNRVVIDIAPSRLHSSISE